MVWVNVAALKVDDNVKEEPRFQVPPEPFKFIFRSIVTPLVVMLYGPDVPTNVQLTLPVVTVVPDAIVKLPYMLKLVAAIVPVVPA